LAAVQQQRKAKKDTAKAGPAGKAILKTLDSGEDKLGDYFQSSEDLQQEVEKLISQGFLTHDGVSYSLTAAGKAAITPKPRKKRKYTPWAR